MALLHIVLLVLFTLTTAIEQQQPLLLPTVIVHDPEVYSGALSIIRELNKGPTCHQLATKDLLHSCQAIANSGDSESSAWLDKVKSAYAIRLAVCELATASIATPDACLKIVPEVFVAKTGSSWLPWSGRTISSGQLDGRLVHLDQQQLNLCLEGLGKSQV